MVVKIRLVRLVLGVGVVVSFIIFCVGYGEYLVWFILYM